MLPEKRTDKKIYRDNVHLLQNLARLLHIPTFFLKDWPFELLIGEFVPIKSKYI